MLLAQNLFANIKLNVYIYAQFFGRLAQLV